MQSLSVLVRAVEVAVTEEIVEVDETSDFVAVIVTDDEAEPKVEDPDKGRVDGLPPNEASPCTMPLTNASVKPSKSPGKSVPVGSGDDDVELPQLDVLDDDEDELLLLVCEDDDDDELLLLVVLVLEVVEVRGPVVVGFSLLLFPPFSPPFPPPLPPPPPPTTGAGTTTGTTIIMGTTAPF